MIWYELSFALANLLSLAHVGELPGTRSVVPHGALRVRRPAGTERPVPCRTVPADLQIRSPTSGMNGGVRVWGPAGTEKGTKCGASDLQIHAAAPFRYLRKTQ